MKLLKTILSLMILGFTFQAFSQGITTSSLRGIITDSKGNPLPGANIIAVHEPSGTQYGTASRSSGTYDIQNMKVGGPYKITVSYVGYEPFVITDLFLDLGEQFRIDFPLTENALELEQMTVIGKEDALLNSSRTGAGTFVEARQIEELPSIKRSTRDITRLDPRSDGNYSFAGKNWLYNSISLDGSYFNNAFGLDDPAPGGQTDAEPVPFDAVEQVQVSVAPYDVREGGFTGAGINTVTKSGTNTWKASTYTYYRDENFVGNEVSGNQVVANPSLYYNMSGLSVSGPIIPNTLFFFVNGEIERREDPATDYVADRDGNITFGESRVRASVMDSIRQRMIDVYNYDPGKYENYSHFTQNEKLLAKIDWNINENNNLSFRYNRLDARKDLGPHPFVLSPYGSGRGPNESSLPFQNSGYEITNKLNSYALEINSRFLNSSNRLFVSYNQFRDRRNPFSEPFPTIEIAEDGVTYTTLGHEPFSIHNILDQDVFQITDNFSYYLDNHVITAGTTFEYYKFFNSFNIFRHGLFFLPYFLDFEGDGIPNGSTFYSLNDFFNETDPTDPINFRGMIGSGLYKGEFIEVAQLGLYVQDEYLLSKELSLTFGLRVDFPMYFTEPVDNPFSRGLTLLDENDNPETVDQSKLPEVTPMLSPRVGFNWDVSGDRTTQLRGGSGLFTGRIPFVWLGNVISNPGANPNLYPAADPIETDYNSTLAQSFDLNAVVQDFKWPQVWTTNIALDQTLPGDMVGTLEFIYSKDLNSIYVRNADLKAPVRYLPDGRPYFSDASGNELNPDGGAGVYVLDNTDKGYNMNFTAQLRKFFDFGLNATFAYNFIEAKNVMKSTEIASVLWQGNPTTGDPNKPELSDSEFGQKHRFITALNYRKEWDENFATTIGVFMELGQGNRFVYSGGNRYSFIYAGDVNGDGSAGNDLIYIPKSQDEIILAPYTDASGNVISADEQWERLNAFIEQDDYLSKHRGEIAERFGLINPWFFNIDMKIMQDFMFQMNGQDHKFQVSLDILNVPNLLSSDWGVRKVASASALSPLKLVEFDASGAPVFNYTNTSTSTFIDDPGIFSRWQMQLGIRYQLN